MKIILKLGLITSFLFTLQVHAEEYSAQYRVTFIGEWTVASHPIDFPGGAHFSTLIGNTHNEEGFIWRAAETATAGMEQMAETGGTGSLAGEINNMIMNTGSSEDLIFGTGNIAATGMDVIEFGITESHPLFSIVTMIAPSPDWFVGVDRINLLQSGVWVDELMVDLQPYDAGTDSGSTFTSGNINTSPKEPIQQISQSPLPDNIPLGVLMFELISSEGLPDLLFTSGFEEL
ncbi:MAG: spondin domain-containing protein [Proteobacteria bacterium]|nr:spondin domain-containing protein [Pseudomonadota bacterium]